MVSTIAGTSREIPRTRRAPGRRAAAPAQQERRQGPAQRAGETLQQIELAAARGSEVNHARDQAHDDAGRHLVQPPPTRADTAAP